MLYLNVMNWGRKRLLPLGAIMASCLLVVVAASPVVAQSGNDANFSLEVSPSPLMLSLKPGEQRTVPLQIRNTGSATEELKLGLREFKVDEQGNVNLQDGTPREVENWISFAQPEFKVQPGEVFNEQISVNVPTDTAFTYTFAITIARTNQPRIEPGKQAIRGTVAVLSIISIDKPGAVRKFEVLELQSSKRLYEYLPADFTVKIKNNGNVPVQPLGNLFVQRKNSNEPLSALSFNTKNSYVLPSSTRDLTVGWEDGFPAYKTEKKTDNDPGTRKLVWDWSKAQNFRFGRYTAKLVAVYNDGQRDIPVYAEVSFWVVPWKLLLLMLVILSMVVVGVVVIVKKALRLRRYVGRTPRRHHHE